MIRNKLNKEVTHKEDGRTLIYYTWETERSGKDQSETKTGDQANGGMLAK